MPSSLLFDFNTKIITVPIEDSSLDLQFLIDEIRSAEHNLAPGMGYPKIADAYGKQDLGGGLKVGITVVLLDGWRVAFAERPGPSTISVSITGGNFVGEAGANPVAPTPYTQVTISQSTSATLVSSQADTNLVYLVETLRSMHPAFGSVFYWDPDNGNDGNTGTSPTTATKTFAAAQTLAVAGRSDVIFCRPTGGSGSSTSTETITISKSNLRLRGPGINMRLIPTDDTVATVRIMADNVEFSGFYVSTAATGSRNAVEVSSDNCLVRDCLIENARGSGLYVTSAARSRLLTSVIENCGGSGTGNGIILGASATQTLISRTLVSGNVSGISVGGSGAQDNVIENCIVYNNSNYGISIESGATRTMVRGANTIVNNTTNTNDAGTDTYIESQAGGASASEIADAVWDEVLTSHGTASSAATTLKDAKKKATLASLK